MQKTLNRRTTKPKRYVRIDSGYGRHENYQTVKVISSQTVNNLFGNGTSEMLLVELNDGSREWVSSWEEIPETQTSKPR